MFLAMIKKRINREIEHFRELSLEARQLLLSYALFEFAYPLFFTFITTFILRRQNDFLEVAVYNLASFFTIPIAFWLNGWLFKYVSLSKMYAVGLVSQGLIASLVFFIPFQGYLSLFIFGLLQGLAMGLYWGNRNYLSLSLVSDNKRTFFTGLEMIAAIFASLVVPPILGTLLSFAERTQLYTVTGAYQVSGVIGIILLSIAGAWFLKKPIKNPQPQKLFITQPNKLWNQVRLSEIFRGTESGLMLFAIPLITFTLLGKEAELGTLQGLAALISMVLIYSVVRKVTIDKRLSVARRTIEAFIGITGLFAATFSIEAAILLVLSFSFIQKVRWSATNPISMRAIDLVDGENNQDTYAYVADREFFLNVGRVFGVLFLAAMMYFFGQVVAIRYVLLITAILQIFFWLQLKKIVAICASPHSDINAG